MRVLPRENDDINECWLSDKDRFAYEGLNASSRLVKPMIKQDGKWEEVDWQVALDFVAKGLLAVRERHGANQIGALGSAHQTVEELYLLQKLLRGLGSENIDFRTRQSDFSADAVASGAPWLGMPVAEIASLDRVLVIGSSLRNDHPLLALRLRQAAKKKLELNLINPVDDDLLMRVAAKSIVAPSGMAGALAAVINAVAQIKGAPLPADVPVVAVDAAALAIASSMAVAGNSVVWLGNLAQHHPSAGRLHWLAEQLAGLLGAKFGFLGEAANSVGGYLAEATPRSGLNARQMLEKTLKAYLLLGVEPECDSYDAAQALAAMKDAEFVVALSPYQHQALEYANALLPIAPFSETSGTFISTEGRVQSFNGIVLPLAETRPAWKVLRVLGNLAGLPGFDYDSSEAVRRDAIGDGNVLSRLDNSLRAAPVAHVGGDTIEMERIGEVAPYQADAIVRRAAALQKSAVGAPPVATMNGMDLTRLGINDGDSLKISQGSGVVVVSVKKDDKLPAHCIRIPGGHEATAVLGGLFGSVSLEPVVTEQKVAV